MSRPREAFGIYVFMFCFHLDVYLRVGYDIGKIHGYLEILPKLCW